MTDIVVLTVAVLWLVGVVTFLLFKGSKIRDIYMSLLISVVLVFTYIVAGLMGEPGSPIHRTASKYYLDPAMATIAMAIPTWVLLKVGRLLCNSFGIKATGPALTTNVLVVLLGFVALTSIRAFFPDEIPQQKWSETALAEWRHFQLAVNEYSTMAPSTEVPEGQQDQWITTTHEALGSILRHAEHVSDSMLEKLHADMPEHFRREFLRGMQLGFYGFDQGDEDSLSAAIAPLEKWGTWYNARISQLGVPK